MSVLLQLKAVRRRSASHAQFSYTFLLHNPRSVLSRSTRESRPLVSPSSGSCPPAFLKLNLTTQAGPLTLPSGDTRIYYCSILLNSYDVFGVTFDTNLSIRRIRITGVTYENFRIPSQAIRDRPRDPAESFRMNFWTP